MSRGEDLQEMEVGTKQSRTAVNASAKPAEPMPKLTTGIPDGQTGGWEDLGGPTPQNYKSDDDSAKLKDSNLKQVRDVVNRGSKSADPMEKMTRSEEYDEEDVEVLEETEDYAEEDAVDEFDSDSEIEEEVDNELEEESEEDSDYYVSDEFDIDEDVNALLEGEDLSEEFQERARLIFESALKAKALEIREALNIQYAKQFEEEVEEMKLSLQERVDSYLEYVSDEWFNENKLSIEKGIKEELTESFLTGLKGLFEEHYVEIPEEKYDVLESMVEKLDDMETKLNEQIEKNISLNKRLSESVAEGIFDEVSEGLALSQKEKLASLAESVEFESDEEYREKLETLRESYFPTKIYAPTTKTETLSEGIEAAPDELSGTMAAYLKTLSGFRKN